MQAGSLYVNFGFWDVVKRSTSYPPGHFNRLIEREVMRLGGIKSLYSESYFTPEEFDQMYGLARHQTLKSRYDPTGRMLGLYEKCVLRA
jgi:FAD/FMN-containing dehydrogenase